LLHLSSLDAALGRGGRAFVDWLAAAGFTVWQFLPLGPTGTDGSPYWVRSDSAGNPLLIDRNELPDFGTGDFGAFLGPHRDWLDAYARFERRSGSLHGEPWWQWPAEYRDREPASLDRARRDLGAELDRLKKEQFAFAVQWRRLRDYAHSRGVRL